MVYQYLYRLNTFIMCATRYSLLWVLVNKYKKRDATPVVIPVIPTEHIYDPTSSAHFVFFFSTNGIGLQLGCCRMVNLFVSYHGAAGSLFVSTASVRITHGTGDHLFVAHHNRK